MQGGTAPSPEKLQFFGMEEGRVRINTPQGGGAGYFVYDYFLSDHLGNTRVVLTDDYNVSGPIIEAAGYYPHGLKMAAIGYKAAIGVANPSQYQGGFSDFEEETGWNSFALRNYDPQTGRFVQQDPFDQFASGYTGMGNDPVNNADPSGGFSVNFGTLGQVTGSALADRALVTLAGAAAGYGIDRAMGGNGWKGAAAGGAMALGGTFVPPFDIGTVVASGADYVANGIKQNGIEKAAASQVTATNVSDAYQTGGEANSTTFSFQYASYGDGWNDLYKADLTNYFKSKFNIEPTALQLGNLYEKIFFDWMSPQAIGRNFRMNNTRWDDAGGRNTVPDMTGNVIFQQYENFIPKGLPADIQNGSAFEVKSGQKGIYLSSNNGQIKGHLNNMAARFKTLIAKGFDPHFTLVTTADVSYSSSINKYAKYKKIKYLHLSGQYRIVNGKWEFQFINLGRRYFWNGVKQIFKSML